MTDEQAMWRVSRHDDVEAFAELVRRWERPIQGLGVRLTGDPWLGQDLAQDAFARLFARRKSYQPNGTFSTYLWRIAVNLCHDHWRRQKIRMVSWDDDGAETAIWETLPSPEPGPDATAMQAETNESVRRALRCLPETHRLVVVLRHYENLKFREIAQVLGIPEGTVKSRMADALTQLQRLLQQTAKPAKLCQTKIDPVCPTRT
jgi:RNA polymerase sigma-70 factor, ECF subfamily